MAKRIRKKASTGRCCGADFPDWRMAENVDEYHIPSRTLVTLLRIGRSPNEKYKLRLKAPTGSNPCPGMKPMVLIPVARKIPSEISAATLCAKIDHWKQDYLKFIYYILSSGYNYKIGVGRVDHIPTLAVFIQSKYDGCPGHCRTFALVLKKLNEPDKEENALQGGVLHGTEN
jgi:hypothetical protein